MASAINGREDGSLLKPEKRCITGGKWCPGAESNHRHCDFQFHTDGQTALPLLAVCWTFNDLRPTISPPVAGDWLHRGFPVASKNKNTGSPLPEITLQLVNRTAAESSADVWVWDSELKGFGLRVRPKSGKEPGGRKVYVFEYRPKPGGRSTPKRRITIGQHGSPWTPKTARDEARRLLGVVAHGGDPAASQAEHRAAATVADLGARFLKEHVATKRKPATASQYRRLLRLFIEPAIGRRKVADVTRQDVMRLHDSMRRTPYQGNRVLALVSTLFAFAELAGERPSHSNPAYGVERFPERARERLLSPAELGWIGEALRDAEAAASRLQALSTQLADARRAYATAREANDRRGRIAARRRLERLRVQWRAADDGRAVLPQAAACIRLLLFTGARLGEILTLTWPTVDTQRGEARLGDSKTGQKTIHFPAPALEVLATLPRLTGNPYVIVGERTGGHLVGIQRPWQQIRNAATVKGWAANPDAAIAGLVRGLASQLRRAPTFAECQQAADAAGVELPTLLSDLRLHDLRHAFASVAAGAGMGLPIIGKLLGHTQAATTQRYAHLASDPLKAAAATIAGSIATSVNGRQAGMPTARRGKQ